MSPSETTSELAARQHRLVAAVADRTLRFSFGTWYWGDAIAVDALLAAHRVVGGPYRDSVLGCLERWARVAPPSFDDALVPGRAVLELVEEGSLPTLAADRVVAALERLPLLDDVVPALEPHRPLYRFGVCIDALYHLPVMMRLAGRADRDEEAEKAALAVTARILDLLACPGGWAQWYDFAVGRNNAVAWSRGLGWALLGLLDLLELTGPSARGAVEEGVGSILQTLAATQGRSGHWASVLGDPEADEETSTAAFFVAACLHPQAAAVGLPAEASIGAASAALLAAVTESGAYAGVSADILPGWDLAGYRHFATEVSPWGQGAALRALTAIAASPRHRG